MMKNIKISKTMVICIVLMQLVVVLGCKIIPGGNHPPRIAEEVIYTTSTQSNMLGEITGVTTMITIQPSDEDGDVLNFAWSATTGTISGKGPSGTWQREVTNTGELVPGTVTVVVSDGKGGEAKFTYDGQ
jgi:hypothetical protein